MQDLIYIFLLYSIFSITEWTVHKYLMHSKFDISLSNDHWIHHRHTKDDMKLSNGKNYNKEINIYRGLYFTWKTSIYVFFVAFLLSLCLRYFVYIPLIRSTGYTLIFIYYQSSMWNTVHPEIHDVHYKFTLKDGIPPNKYYKSLPYYNFLIRNHIKHHEIKGENKGNYNVTLPLADFILGSYNF